ncbi:IS1182 family transposase [Flavobacterium sp.]|uniref:IS1182 family transposase n=1 Tax=Flavobacterium sp. TaxID=239 RepID=UPI0025E0A754|nr:IS1182 family transposase [Flavobacterium sp.]
MSKFITGKDRNQTEFFCLEQTVDKDNIVRIIDLFVNSLSLKDLGFKTDFIENGRPAYHPADLLKLSLYGYLNRTRSSRQLEKECSRNMEVMWLLKGLVPDHNTIANFRKNNPRAIAKVFQSTVSLANHFNLIGGKLVAGDSTKLRAQNSKKNNFNPSKIERHIAYIDAKLLEYQSLLAQADGDVIAQKEIQEKVIKSKQQKQKYQDYQKKIDDTGSTQISTSDPDSRQMITRNNITEVAYNVQTVVDEKHNIPIDFKVTNQNDSKAMGAMLRRAKTIIGHTDFVALYDKGYHTGSEFEYANQLGIEVLVAIPDVASHAPNPDFDVEHFVYDKQSDTLTCPANQTLTNNGNWYNKVNGKSITKMKHYKTSACLTCHLMPQCTKNKRGRLIERSQHADVIHQNKIRIEQNKALYRKRQAIVEHPYGIIKRQWDFYYIMTKKSIKHASADVGLIFIAFNLRRIFNLIEPNLMKKYLKMLWLYFDGFNDHFKAVVKEYIFSYTVFGFCNLQFNRS